MTLGLGIAVVAGYVLTGDLLGSAALLVLYLCWWMLKGIPGPPVLFLALAYHWLQTSLGLFYTHVSGRDLIGTTAPSYRLMVMICLGCVLALAIGIRLGYEYARRRWPDRTITEEVFT